MIERLNRISRKMKRDFEILVNESPEQAGSAVRRYRKPGNIITAVGGDGAINHVLNDLAGTDTILSFLPVGTGNDFFRTCKETIPDGIQNMDMIRINDRYFINTACFGIDADIANDDHFIHNRFIPRPLRYHFSVLFHFFTYGKGRHLKVLCDGKEIENDFLTIVAANGRYYGGGYKVSPGSLPDDGLMEVYLVDSMPKIRMAATILSMKHAGHLKNPAVHMIRTKELQIISDRPINASIDGEAMQSDHFDLKLIPKGIALEFNSEFIDSLWKDADSFRMYVIPKIFSV